MYNNLYSWYAALFTFKSSHKYIELLWNVYNYSHKSHKCKGQMQYKGFLHIHSEKNTAVQVLFFFYPVHVCAFWNIRSRICTQYPLLLFVKTDLKKLLSAKIN